MAEMRVPEIGKFSTARAVCTPQYAAMGICFSPRKSCSVRVAVTGVETGSASGVKEESGGTGNHQKLDVTNCKFAGLKTPMLFQRSSMHFSYNHLGLLLVVSLMPAFARKANQLQRLPVA
jgi:hypothetical protein